MKAVAYYRTSSATNVGGDSLERQTLAVEGYARGHRFEIVESFYDAAVSGADPLEERPGFAELLGRIAGNGVKFVLVEDASRFARDLMVQLTGHAKLKELGVELVPVNAPEHFRDETPTAVLISQILGAVAQFEKAQMVAKLKGARERAKRLSGRCEGRKPQPVEAVRLARQLKRKRWSLREIPEELAKHGWCHPDGRPWSHETVRRMLG